MAHVSIIGACLACAAAATASGGPLSWVVTSPTYRLLKQDILINADCWDTEPRILASGLGFTKIIGIPGLGIPGLGEWLCRAAGGTWNDVPGDNVPLRAHTSAASPFTTWISYGRFVFGLDGYPTEFSWPVQPSTVDPTDFRVTLSDGSVVTPEAASIFPNFEFNERSTVVIFGEFGDRRDPYTDPDAVYVVKFEVVQDDTPLTLIGPGGKMASAVGMSYGDGVTPMTAYASGSGPTLCAAKISRLRTLGDNGPRPFQGALPNHGKAIWGPQAKYRLRVLTTGGFSPDGVASVLPSDFSRFFRLRAETSSGDEVWITDTNTVYEIDGHELEVLGLADLGLTADQDPWTLAYAEDHDNQIDIILRGDSAAMRTITHVHIPASGTYDPFYNPGGPGNDPTPGVTYTQPGPETMQPVLDCLDDPLTVTWIKRQ
ncbi:MAG: hypothetical protein QF471_04010 [Phycisphaerales bacterium]|nr:hypothetical protein [Phycisphaerales bacterium]